ALTFGEKPKVDGQVVIAPQRLAVVPLPPKPDANWGWRGHFSYGDTKVGDCAFREGGVFSFISVDCGLRVGDREGDEEVKLDEKQTSVEVVNCTDEPVEVKVFEPGAHAASRLFRSPMAEGTISPSTNRVFHVKASNEADTNLDVEIRISNKKAKCEVVGDQVIFVDGLMGDQ
ncbi:PPM-type phosphatase domain-containing protein, partial [Durusdinium trenchii]